MIAVVACCCINQRFLTCVPWQVVIGYTVGVAAMLLAFWSTPASLPWLQWATVFMIGFFLYGPQMLIGLCGAELVGPESVGASEGFLGWVAYLGKCRSCTNRLSNQVV